jgi:hypothetical protein
VTGAEPGNQGSAGGGASADRGLQHGAGRREGRAVPLRASVPGDQRVLGDVDQAVAEPTEGSGGVCECDGGGHTDAGDAEAGQQVSGGKRGRSPAGRQPR